MAKAQEANFEPRRLNPFHNDHLVSQQTGSHYYVHFTRGSELKLSDIPSKKLAHMYFPRGRVKPTKQ